MFVSFFLARYPLLFDSLVTLLIFLVGVSLGRKMVRLLRLEIPDALERGVFSGALGLGALTFLPFLLFALGIGFPRVVVGALLVLAVVLLPEEMRLARGAARGIASAFGSLRESGSAWRWVLALALAPLLLVTFLQALCPPTDPDGLSYHLTAPIHYLSIGHFAYMPTFLHVNWPLSVEMLFGIGLAFNWHYAAGLIQFGLGLLLLLGTYALGRRIASPTVGWLGASLLFVFIRGQMTWAYIDVGLTLFTLTSIYAFFIGWQSLQEREAMQNEEGMAIAKPEMYSRWWTLSAMLAGLAAISKLPGVLSVLVVAVMVFLTLRRTGTTSLSGQSGEAFLPALRSATGYLLVGLLFVAPWYIRCWLQTGSPVYPMFWSLLGARDWDAAANKRFNEYVQVFNTLRTWNPTPQMVVKARLVSCVLLAVLGIAACRWRGSRTARPLIAFVFVIAFLQVATSGIYVRYFFPIFPLIMVLPFWLARKSLAQSSGARWLAVAFVSLYVWGLWKLPSTMRNTLHAGREAFLVAIGKTSRDDYLASRLPIYPALRWANERLPQDATLVLGVWDAYAALVHHRVLVTNQWVQNALRFDTWENFVADLHRLRATHLILKDEPPPTAAQLAAMNKEDHERTLGEFARLRELGAQYGQLLHTENGYALYALQLPTATVSRK